MDRYALSTSRVGKKLVMLNKLLIVLAATVILTPLLILGSSTALISPEMAEQMELEHKQKLDTIYQMVDKPPPLKQIFQFGIDTGDVVCSENLILMLKWAGTTSACVKPQTVQLLVERGWGVIRSDYQILEPSFCFGESEIYYKSSNHNHSTIIKAIRDTLYLLEPNSKLWYHIDITHMEDRDIIIIAEEQNVSKIVDAIRTLEHVSYMKDFWTACI